MRPKVVFGVLLLAFGLLGIALFFKFSKNQPAPIAQVEEVSPPASASIKQNAAGQQRSISNRIESNGTQVVTRSVTPAIRSTLPTRTNLDLVAQELAHAQYVRERKAAFYDLSMNDDQDSLNILLSELKNPDKSLRQAALESVIQFDDRSAIPRLEELAAQAKDPKEKIEILQAIEFMKLPSLSEFVEQRTAERSALGITNKTVSTRKSNLAPPEPLPQGQPQENP